jgi:hypothetical protein
VPSCHEQTAKQLRQRRKLSLTDSTGAKHTFHTLLLPTTKRGQQYPNEETTSAYQIEARQQQKNINDTCENNKNNITTNRALK